ncbi:hypothetical protein V8J82_23250 [Gymnodinialimonas sp. 2305UL16-5]|uniref:hypothetical protein n=1 Tax=Gymnodinialimonas mytili TaxID=3126503 RepID=UPI0030AD11AE
MPQNPWNGSGTPSRRPLRRPTRGEGRAPHDTNRTLIIVFGWLFGIPIAISAIYIAFPDLRILFYLSLIGAPLAILLDIIFSAAPYLIVIWGAAYLLNAFLPRLPGAIAILSPLLVVCGWLYFHANALNAERRAMADEAFALGESASTDRVDISRLALTASRTDCDLMCQKLLVSETVDQVLLFASPPEDLSPEHLATTPVVVWRLGERTNCPTPRLSRSITSRMTEDDQDFAVYVQTLALSGRCIFEEPGTLDAATAILHRITVTDDTFHGRAVRVYSVNAGALELAHASGGGTLLEVPYPPFRIRVPVGMFERVERAYMTRRVPYGANLEALSDETILGVIAGVDSQTMEFVYSDGQGFSRHSALLNAVHLADDPNNTALQQALIDYASAFSDEVDGQVYGDLELVLAVLRNPGSPVPPNLSQVIPPSEILPEGILNDIAEAAWVRIEAARDNEIGALGVFRALPDPIIAS